MSGISVTWYEGITVDSITPILKKQNLVVKCEDKLREFILCLQSRLRALNTRKSHNVMRDLNRVLRNPEELFILFDLCVEICATTQTDGDDHGYAHSKPRLRSAFTVTLLQLSQSFYNRKPNASYPSAPFIMTDFEDLTDTEKRHLNRMGGWALKRAGEIDKTLLPLINMISEPTRQDTGQYLITVTDPFLEFFHKLSSHIKQALNMTDFNIHGSQLAKYIIDNKLQQNAGLHSEFYRLFPDHTSKHVMISLLQRISEVSTKSSVHNFLIDHRLNPDKQSQALRVGLSCGKKNKKSKTVSTSSVATTSIQPQPSTSAASTSTAEYDCFPNCKDRLQNGYNVIAVIIGIISAVLA